MLTLEEIQLPKYPVFEQLEGDYDHIIAIGDVHGCYDELMDLIEEPAIYDKLVEKKTALIYLGDLIDRGPWSSQVLGYVRRSAQDPQYNTFCVLGNHSECHLRYQQHVLKGGTNPMKKGEEFLKVHNSLTDDDFKWIAQNPAAIKWQDWIFTHAGIGPSGFNMPLKGFIRTRYFEFKEDINQWFSSRTWQNEQSVWCHNKNAVHWTEIYSGQEKVVYGHEPRENIYINGNTYGIDTGCYEGGKLSALILDCHTKEVTRSKQEKHA